MSWTFLRPGMTVESSMKRWLIFSRRFRSAMMWSCEYGADEDDAEILAEALLAGGDTCCVIFGTATPLPPPPPLAVRRRQSSAGLL